MQSKLKYILLGLLLIIGISFADQAATSSAPASNAAFNDPKQAILVNSASPTFVLRLESNRTTGYSWFVKKLDRRNFKIEKHSYIAPSTQMAGAPGYEEWTILAKPNLFKPNQVAKITLIYARPWEKQAGKEVTFIVKPAS